MSLIFQHILTGFLVKSIASFDDTLTRIPILAELTKTIRGKIAFSIGTLLGLTLILVISIFFSFLFDLIPFRQYVLAILILILSLAIYFELFIPKEKKALKHEFFKHPTTISHVHFLKLLAIGFLVSFITFLDDALVLIPLFVNDHASTSFSVIGIYLAAILQILIVIFFSHKLEKIKFTKEIATVLLIILAILVGMGVI